MIMTWGKMQLAFMYHHLNFECYNRCSQQTTKTKQFHKMPQKDSKHKEKKAISQEANQSINKIRRLLEDYARCSNVDSYKNLFFTPLTRQLCSHFIFKAHVHNNTLGKVPGSQIYIYILQSATCSVWQTRHAEKKK